MLIDPDIRARMFAFLAGRDREFWPRDLVAAGEEGRWTIEGVPQTHTERSST
jgi:hypothetical protein